MTAVEWLFENLCSEKLSWIKDSNGKLFFDETTSNIFQQAKEMEKQQIIDAYDKGQEDGLHEYKLVHELKYNGRDYYVENF